MKKALRSPRTETQIQAGPEAGNPGYGHRVIAVDVIVIDNRSEDRVAGHVQ